MSDAHQERRYWRSVERLLESPALHQEPSPELADGADLPPDELTRRSVMKLLGASFALAGLTGCRRPEEHIVPYVQAPEGLVPGVPQRYATTFPLGADAYGLLVESHEGRPTKVEGNPQHPATCGAATAWMQAATLELYDPDRSRRVLRRQRAAADEAGEGGEDEPGLQAGGWDDFVAAWRQGAEGIAAGGGAGLAVLVEETSSPTLGRLVSELRRRYPAARVVAWSPVSDGAIYRGLGGRRPWYDLEHARVVLALDCDLLLTESNSLHHARGFAAARRPERAAEGMLRLYAVESTLTLTGANADHRLRLQSRRVPAFLAALGRELGVAAGGGDAARELPAEVAARVPVIARDLRAAGSGALVAAGRRQPEAVHRQVLAINQALGAVGTTLALQPLADVLWGEAEGLRELVAGMAAGEVETLVMVGGNPAYDAPADLGFAAALDRVPVSVHLSSRRDETSRRATWHLPRAHFLEAWGDARSVDGTASVIQPLIAPLLGGISDVELLALVAHGEARPGHEEVRETWAARGVGGEEAWRQALHDGVLPPGSEAGAGTAAMVGAAPAPEPAAEAEPAAAAVPPAAGEGSPAGGEDGYEIVFCPSPYLWDGRFANNAWLQELPHPLTKVTWGNAALVSPATAAELGVGAGDRLLLNHAGHKLALPVFVLPGQADGSIAVELGYGRAAAGRVGDGVGRDAYRLRTAAAPWIATAVTAHRTWGDGTLVQTQEHARMEGRQLVREAPVAAFLANPGFAQEPEAKLRLESLWPEPAYDEGPQWGMAVDLSRCIGCMACVAACQSENNIPVVGPEMIARGREMHWLRVDRYFAGDAADPEVVFQPVPCMHCENAPCEQVCPVAATVHDGQGLNLMVYNRCIGTRYCSNNCPYKVRRFNFFNYTKATPEIGKMAMNPDVTVRSRGVMEKCTYCVQRISEGKLAAKSAGRELRDGDVVTACQQSCPTEAILFGDLLQADSRVVERKASPRDYTLLAELNNKPRTTYQAKIRNPNPEWT
ncbi:MAG TPA: TAT-variant-translocated molybdopterin oxidoreductase [Thermoanaerobaculia bacterium]|nr:TAT-variant-translocated molybdopterin oxidoreductase [Thermoanaerobaculia bacterium]